MADTDNFHRLNSDVSPPAEADVTHPADTDGARLVEAGNALVTDADAARPADGADVHRLRFEDKVITIVGTAHVSRESVHLVGRVIDDEKPDTVCVELCRSRYESMTQENRWKNTDLLKVVREKKALLLLSNLLLAHFQKKIGKKLGVKPGEEMMRAIEAAQEVGAHIHLADRDVRTTLSRAWRSMNLKTKVKLMFQFVASLGEVDAIKEEDIEEMKKKDVLDALLLELGESHPDLKRILIDERDLYLAHEIRTAPGRHIVAVVGAGHVPGIERNWDLPVDMEELDRVPPKGKLAGLMKWIIPVLMVGFVALGFFKAGTQAGTNMILWWVLANATLAGIGAAIALAHPLTILSAMLASPLTSLNPMIAAGWVSGVVEALLGKPKVVDFESLPEDILTLKGFWKNKITRILLVVVFTNMGSVLGTFVAIPLMVRAFG